MRELLRQLATDRVINVDKPTLLTSYEAVDEIKRLSGLKKVGHAGSLDPFATGVLLVCTGRATKITRFLMELRKEYAGTIRLGSETDTDDSTGEIKSELREFTVSSETLHSAASTLVGTILQHPPKVSALKRNGRRLYEMVRSGVSFETEPRKVTIYEFKVKAFHFPDVQFSLQCSRGTYVRSVARDLGRALGCGAHLRELRRTRVGQFAVEDSATLETLKRYLKAYAAQESAPEEPMPGSCSMSDALCFLPGFLLKHGIFDSVLDGRSPLLTDFEAIDATATEGSHVRILSGAGELLAVGKITAADSEPVVRLERVLATRGI